MFLWFIQNTHFLIGNIYFKGRDLNFKFTLICIFWLVIIEIDWITLWGAYFLCTLLIMFPYVGVGDCRHQIDSIFCLHFLEQFILVYGHLRYKMWQLLMNMWMRNIQFKMRAEIFSTLQLYNHCSNIVLHVMYDIYLLKFEVIMIKLMLTRWNEFRCNS